MAEFVAEYHNALDNYYETVAEYTKYVRYYGKLYYDGIEQLEAKYAGRDKDEILQAKYEVEKKTLEKQWEQAQEKMEVPYNKLHGDQEAYEKVNKASGVELFNDLWAEYGSIIDICIKNDSYMAQQEKLKDKRLDKKVRADLKKENAQLEKQILELIEKEQKQRGENWKDKCRNPVTGELPGGLLVTED